MNYKHLIENTVIPSSLSTEEKCKLYNPIIASISQILPSKLYRFRNCSENNISSFLNDELWFSNGSTMNDDFDARLYYDRKHIQHWLNSLMSEDGYLKLFHQINSINTLPDFFNSLIPNINYTINILKNISKEQSKLISNQLVNFIKNNLDISVKEIVQTVQSLTKFACFSEKIYSDMMWGHYADSGTGFALEYTFGSENVITYKYDTNNQSIIYGNLFPIIYGNQRLNATDYTIYLFQAKLLQDMAQLNGLNIPEQWINMIIPCPDQFVATKLAIKKSCDWKPEKEWRMFYTTNDLLLANQQYSYVSQRPSAIYLGSKISKLNQKILVDIAKEKDIPAYKMDINDNSQTYKLRKYKLI